MHIGREISGNTSSQKTICLARIVALLCACMTVAWSQAPKAYVKIAVVSKSDGQPVSQAVVAFYQHGTLLGTDLTNEEGRVEFRELSVGRYTMRVTAIGYVPVQEQEILLLAGSQYLRTLELETSRIALQEVEIKHLKSQDQPEFTSTSAKSFTIEQSQRFAATFFDPAFLARSYAGVSAANDMGNNMVIRGNTPQGVLWRLEGADIVNPNHFANGGTMGDRISLSGGGVSIMSGQVMDASTFYMGAFPAEYSNVLSGVMDLRLRKGRPGNMHSTLQAGLIGLEAMVEGPFGKKKRSTFLINYRYSFTGLLGLLGVKFGGQSFDFQDLSYHLNFPIGKKSEFSVFGVGGVSLNDFRPDQSKLADTTLTDADRTEFRFLTSMGAQGIRWKHYLGRRHTWSTSSVLSASQSNIQFSYWPESAPSYLTDKDNYTLRKWSTHTHLLSVWRGGLKTKAGVVATAHSFDLASVYTPVPYAAPVSNLEGQGTIGSWAPYAQAQIQVLPHWEIIPGMQVHHLTQNSETSIDPRLALKGTPGTRWQLGASYGHHSMMQPIGTYFTKNPTNEYYNSHLKFTKAHHLTLAATYHMIESLHIKTEAYYQWMYQVPVSTTYTTVSILNSYDGFLTMPLQNQGRGRNRGIELTVEKQMTQGWYLIQTFHLFSSEYQGTDGVWRNTRFDGRYSQNTTLGKEWSAGKKSTLGANIRAFYAGGMYQVPIDTLASQTLGRSVSAVDQGFTQQLPDYFRIDLRLMWRKHSTKSTHTLSLDVQNLSNTQNVAFYFYDRSQNVLLPKYQLGLIPILNYRVEFW